jgi:hypothetical protein
MTSQTSSISSWRRTVTGAVASGALAAGLLMGASVATAHADVLDDINQEYDTGAGGGQVSNLIHKAIKFRAMGYVPSKGNVTDLEAALAKRPNQTPLIEALQQTVAYQARNQARAQAPAKTPSTFGIGQLPPGTQQGPTNPDDGGISIAPGGGPAGPGAINVPLG